VILPSYPPAIAPITRNWQRCVRWVGGEIPFAGVEAQERSALAGRVVANGAAEHWVAVFQRVENRLQRYWPLDVELHLARNVRQVFQVIRDDDADHGNV
jgi:hypothetical protein